MSLRKTKSELRTFLSRWANLGDDPDVLDGFWAAYRSWFRPGAFELFPDPLIRGLHEGWEERSAAALALGRNLNGRQLALLEIRSLMRGAWDTASVHERQWKLHPLRDKLNRLSASSEEELEKPPTPNDADSAIVFLSSIAQKLKLCDNSDCRVERYLIGVKKMPKFCQACGNVERSRFKAKWWEERKTRLNAQRRRDYKASKSQRKSKDHKH